MKKSILLVLVVGMVGWAVYDFFDSNKNSADELKNEDVVQEIDDEEIEEAVIGLEVGNEAPDFQLETLTGESVKLSDFRGNRVMINFWATWCPPCRAEMPDMEKFHQNKDIVILAVNLTDTETSIEDIEDFSDEYKLTFPVLLDSGLNVANLYAIQPVPTTYMVDSNGLISFKGIGAMNYDLMVQAFEMME